MKNIANKFLSNHVQPQVVSLFIVTLILVVLSLVIYSKAKRQLPNKAPAGILFFAEQYVMGVDKFYRDTAAATLQRPAPYIFTLFSFLLLGNLMGLIGFEPTTSSYSVTLTMALISWIGIYVVGITYKRFQFFKRFLHNPLEVVTQIAPLISLSFRLFGNIIGGGTIVFLIYYVTGWIWGKIPYFGEFNLLGAVIAPAFNVYFDLFDGVIHAFVFSLLTTVYWSLEAEVPHGRQRHKEVVAAKTKSSPGVVVQK